MKQYIVSFLCLLAAFTQPAMAQTRAIPEKPVMPYVVTIVQPITGDTANLLTASTSYPLPSTIIKSNSIAYNTKSVDLTVLTPDGSSRIPAGYVIADGYPRVYETSNPTNKVSTIGNGGLKWSFKMPARPVTIEIKYLRVEDLDLGKLSGDIALTYTDGKWIYKTTSGEKTPFTGTVKGIGTGNLKITSDESPTLLLANGTELTGCIELNTGNTYLSLLVEKAGTAIVKGSITATNGRLRCDSSGRLTIYGEVTGDASYVLNLMQWTWTTAPAKGQIITISTPLELPLTTFKADGIQKTFATNFPGTTSLKVKVGEGAQKDGTGTTTFPINRFGYLASFTGMEDSKLEPVKDVDGITITGEDTYKPGTDGSGDKASFSGTVTGDVSTIKVDEAVKGNPVIILEEVKKKGGYDNTVQVAANAEVTLALKGDNNEVSKIEVASGGTLTLTTVVGGGNFVTPPAITNNGTFTSETNLIKTVVGEAPLNVTGEPEGREIAANESHTLGVAADFGEGVSSTAVISYQWQKYNTDEKVWEDIAPIEGEPNSTAASYSTRVLGEYRCKITSTQAPVSPSSATLRANMHVVVTILYTHSAKVTLKPVTYTVTLPALTGATLDPGTGDYTVLENNNFDFTLTLDKDYDQSEVIVSTNRDGEIQADSDGRYTIGRIDTDITVSIEGIVKNSTVGNAAVESGGNGVWADGNQLCIRTGVPVQVWVYTFSGRLATTFSTSGGKYQTQLSAGTYIVWVADKSYKVAISNH